MRHPNCLYKRDSAVLGQHSSVGLSSFRTRDDTLVGHARVRSVGLSLAMQLDVFRKAGCEKVFAEQRSGATPQVVKLLLKRWTSSETAPMSW